MVNLFNRNDGTFAQVDYGDITNTPLTLLTSQTFTGLASVSDTVSLTNASFKVFRFLGHGIVPTTAQQNLAQYFSTNGGTSYFSAAGNYQAVATFVNDPGGAAANGASQFTARAGINNSTIASTATIPVRFETIIFDPATSTADTQFDWWASYPITGGFMERVSGSGYLSASLVNAVQWHMTGGTMSGTIESYGQL
jgi:hypothetical protein